MTTPHDPHGDALDRLFRILREAATLPDHEHDKHRAMTLRALVELACAITDRGNHRRQGRTR